MWRLCPSSLARSEAPPGLCAQSKLLLLLAIIRATPAATCLWLYIAHRSSSGLLAAPSRPASTAAAAAVPQRVLVSRHLPPQHPLLPVSRQHHKHHSTNRDRPVTTVDRSARSDVLCALGGGGSSGGSSQGGAAASPSSAVLLPSHQPLDYQLLPSHELGNAYT